MQNILNFIDKYKQTYSNLCADTRNIQTGDIFCAYLIKNSICNFSYIPLALEKKVSAIIADSQLKDNTNYIKLIQETKIPILYIDDLYKKLGIIASNYYKNTSHDVPIIGITGTNGKTSISQWLAQCLEKLNKKTCVIGTLGTGFLTDLQLTGFTTPDAITLQRQLNYYINQANIKAEIISMEVSSHGLEQYRVGGVKFHSAIFTNLTQDHLDYHGNMQSYLQAKQKLFLLPDLHYAIINVDDEVGQLYIKNSKAKINIAYGMHNRHSYSEHYIWCKKYTFVTQNYINGYEIDLYLNFKQNLIQDKIFVPILGEFNIYNLLAVIASLFSLNYTWQSIKPTLAYIKSVCGRLEVIANKPLVIVDYAHTPDALEKTLTILLSLKYNSHSKLICVFGCGGDRDSSKRYLMGNIVYKLADKVIVTSDNPRFENPQQIINDIINDIDNINNKLIVEIDREQAIKIAINLLNPNDILLIAGKGHEMYQLIQGHKYIFSDQQKARYYLNNIY